MILELVFRFIAGGLIVCAFAVIGDAFRPKHFGGIFGAAPSVALATLGLTFVTKGGAEVSTEGKAMIAGAVALLCYSLAERKILLTHKMGAMTATSTVMAVWFVVAFSIWAGALR
jgi:hypothetical protein